MDSPVEQEAAQVDKGRGHVGSLKVDGEDLLSLSQQVGGPEVCVAEPGFYHRQVI